MWISKKEYKSLISRIEAVENTESTCEKLAGKLLAEVEKITTYETIYSNTYYDSNITKLSKKLLTKMIGIYNDTIIEKTSKNVLDNGVSERVRDLFVDLFNANVKNEEFVDYVVDRINKKQIGGRL